MANSIGGVSIDVDADVSRAARAINKLRTDLATLERAKFSPGSRAAAAADREVNKLNKSIGALGGTVDKNTNFINRHATAINQLAFSAARAGSGFANFLPLLARTTTLLSKHEFGERGIGGALSSLREKFSGAAAGAGGLAGAGGRAAAGISRISFAAVGAVAAVAALVIGLGFLTAKLGPLGSALNKAQDSIRLIFEDSGQEVLEFARKAATAFGITEQAALRFVGKTGQLFKSFGIGSSSAATLSEGLLVVADVLRSTTPEFINAEDALQAVFDTVAGNVEGLRRFDIFLSEIGLSQVALRNGLKGTVGAFDNVQRSLVSQVAAFEIAIERFEQYRNTMDSTQRIAERTKAGFADMKATLGQGLAPILVFVASVMFGVVSFLKDIVKGVRGFLEEHPAFVSALKAVARQFVIMFPGALAVSKVLGFFRDKGEEAGEAALDFDERLQELREGLDAAKDAFNEYNQELNVSKLEQLRDAHIALSRAVEDAARAQQEAEETLARVRVDNQRKIEDAQRKLFRAQRDGERAIKKARVDVADAELSRKRAIRDAEEKLAELRLDSNKKVENAEKALAKAREDRAKAIFHAQLSLEEALFAQDAVAERRALVALADARSKRALEDAQASLEDARLERIKAISKAERDLAETIVDQNKKVAEARIKLMETIEETAENIADAIRELGETEIETNRALYDARQDLLKQQIQGTRNINDAKTALDDLNANLGTTDLTLAQILDKLEKIRNTILSTPDLLDPKKGINATGQIGLQHGGHARGGRPYVIGERGPELFIPNSSGTVVSNEQLLKALTQMGGGRSGQPIVVHEAADPEATAFAVSARLARNVN